MINKKSIEEFEKLKKERIGDESKFSELISNQKKRVIGYIVLLSIILIMYGLSGNKNYLFTLLIILILLLLYLIIKYQSKHEKKPKILSKR